MAVRMVPGARLTWYCHKLTSLLTWQLSAFVAFGIITRVHHEVPAGAASILRLQDAFRSVLAVVRAPAKAGYTVDVGGNPLRRLRTCMRLAIPFSSRYYLDMLRFDWDERKNKSNRIKHGLV